MLTKRSLQQTHSVNYPSPICLVLFPPPSISNCVLKMGFFPKIFCGSVFVTIHLRPLPTWHLSSILTDISMPAWHLLFWHKLGISWNWCPACRLWTVLVLWRIDHTRLSWRVLDFVCHFLHLFKVKLCERGRYGKNLSICVSVIRRSSKLSEHGRSSNTDRKILLVLGKLAGEIFSCLIIFPSELENAGADHHFHLQGREKQIVAQSKNNTPPPFVCSFYLSYVLIFFFISSLAHWIFLICSFHFISLSATFHIFLHLRCCLCNYCLSLSLFWIFALLSLESLILSESTSALLVQTL